jgi:hypothetical protein
MAGGGRLVRGGEPEMLISAGGAGLESPAARRLVLPPSDPALLPALNRRLVEAGVAWRFDDDVRAGELRPSSTELPVDVSAVRVARRYRLVPDDVGGGIGAGRVLVELADGSPFLVAATGTAGDHLLLATPLDDEASTLPVDAAMVPLLEWVISGWGSGVGGGGPLTGEPLPLPPGATSVALPDGTRVPADGTRELRMTRDPGIYTVLGGDSVLERVAVNVSNRESLLTPLSRFALRERLGDAAVLADSPGAWARGIFHRRQGREFWRPLLLVALLLLLVESWMAASGGRADVSSPGPAPVPDQTGSAPFA